MVRKNISHMSGLNQATQFLLSVPNSHVVHGESAAVVILPYSVTERLNFAKYYILRILQLIILSSCDGRYAFLNPTVFENRLKD